MIERLEAVTGATVSREAVQKLATYVGLLETESKRQNLISRTTLDQVWDRHVLDSAQLIRFAPSGTESWLDIGSGAGLPGIVVACLANGPVTLVEPRRLRAEFLRDVVEKLDLSAVVRCEKVERVTGNFEIITARAVASLSQLLGMSAHLSTKKTVWILPKGRNAQSELAEARQSWQGTFHVEPSATDPDSWIVVATNVKVNEQ